MDPRHAPDNVGAAAVGALSSEMLKGGSKRSDHSSDTVVSDQRVAEDVQQLARTYSNQSLAKKPTVYEDGHPLLKKGTSLDPHSEHFNYKSWAKAVLKLQRDQVGLERPIAGVACRSLSVHGFGSALDYQKTVETIWYQAFGYLRNLFSHTSTRIQILNEVDVLIHPHEMLVVLGPPGSGASTYLKTISQEMNGIYTDENAYINYHGIDAKTMGRNYRGECIYTAEVDHHFAQLTVNQTLYFASLARAPRNPPGNTSAHEWAEHRRDVIMAIFGISHTKNTKVGNDFVRGVSGGERKRVSLAEAALSDAPIQCWDNSTRGLDAANAVSFCRHLRLQADIQGTTAALAIYQSPQAAYDCFDKATVLYEGYQIYYGDAKLAKQYFLDLGFECPDRQTVPDFLTSMCSAEERRVQPGSEHRVPRTPQEFARAWKSSAQYNQLQKELDAYEHEFPIGGTSASRFKEARRVQQAKRIFPKSPFTLSYTQQIKLCAWRSYLRVKNDPTLFYSQIFGNIVMALIVSSIFYNLSATTADFFSVNALLFFALLLAGFGSALEILILYAQRPIVEKQARYGFVQPSAEAWASLISDLPTKISNTILTTLIYYFMCNLRRDPGHFFFYLLTAFSTLLAMSHMFRFIGSASRTLTQALVPTAVLILALVIYTGFAINIRNMVPWMRWLNYVDIVAYGFESLMINQYSGRDFDCSYFIPQGAAYANVPAASRICATTSAVAGDTSINGDRYLELAYSYNASHKWRNIGILWAFVVALLACYIVAAEYVTAKKSKGEILVFRRGHAPDLAVKRPDLEAAAPRKMFREKTPTTSSQEAQSAVVEPVARSVEKPSLPSKAEDLGVIKQSSSFSWRDVCYDIKIKGENRVILDHVDGWVEQGRITALMGVSGAGKTSLLDVLAARVRVGIVTGSMQVDGQDRDKSFQRKTGYVQQGDVHLPTSTVREALEFSALLRQPARFSRQEKLAYVDEVIDLLDMRAYADAIVGVPGEGLNVEQRKRLTIGVEMAAKPELLLFLDEPTSGLDSQTSWSILNLLDKLAKAGQSILITCHQPSANLFQRFDRLLLLQKGGRTVYFGEIGQGATTLIEYFERNGAPKCPADANPAEYMLAAIGAEPGSKTDIDWHSTWRNSPEYQGVQSHLTDMRQNSNPKFTDTNSNKVAYHAFAAPYSVQFFQVMKRISNQYLRTPTYIYAKLSLSIATAMFIGLSFYQTGTSQAGLQNQLFAIFAMFTIFSQLGNQLMPLFVVQRELYEARERNSKTYHWSIFMLSNLLIELPWNLLAGSIMFVLWYYLIGFQHNAEFTNTVNERATLTWLYFVQFFLFTSTLHHALIASIDAVEAAGNLASLLFSLTLVFNGTLQPPSKLPRFWIFMYRVSPFTYLSDGMISTAVANAPVVCDPVEFLQFQPRPGQTCLQYMQSYISTAGGYLRDNDATSNCEFCTFSNTNQFLESFGASYGHRWRNFGIFWVYIIANIFFAIFFYWLGRVPKKQHTKKAKQS